MKKLLLCVTVALIARPALADYVGDFILGDTVRRVYDAYALTGADVERTVAGTASCVEDGGTTEITAGVTDTGLSEFDGVVGLNLMTIAATGANGFEAGKDYDCGVRTSTLNGVTATYQVVSFSIENRSISRNRIKDRGTLTSGSTAQTIQLGAKIAANDVWNGMLFRDLTTNETAVICDTVNNGSTDTLSVAGLNTAPGSSDSYQIIADGAPFSCVNFPKVDNAGHVYVGYMGTSSSGEPAIADVAATNLNSYFNNGGALATTPTIQSHYNAATTVWTTTIDGVISARCAMAMGLAALANRYQSTSATAPYTVTFYDPPGSSARLIENVTSASRTPTFNCPP